MSKIGYIQFQPVLGEVNTNIEQMNALLPKASSADLIVLPELANTGYNFSTREEIFACSEEISKSNFVEFLAGFAKHH